MSRLLGRSFTCLYGVFSSLSFLFTSIISWEEQKAPSLSVFCFLPPIRASLFLVVSLSYCFSVKAFAKELVFVASLDWSFRMLLIDSALCCFLLSSSSGSILICTYGRPCIPQSRGLVFMQRMKIQAFEPTHIFNIERNILFTTSLFRRLPVFLALLSYTYDHT